MPLKLYIRNKVWHYRGSVAGNRLRGSCKTADKTIAARKIAEIEAREWKCGFDGPGSVLTFAQAAFLYRSAGKSVRFLDRVENHLKNTLVKDIKPGTIKQMAIDLYPNCSGASRNRLAIVPTMAVINHAADSELCQPIRVKQFKAETKTKEPATLEWIRDFQAHASPHVGALALFMFLTGARIGEAIELQWDEVDMVAKTALIRESKVSSERIAHLPETLIVALANITRVPGRGVFVYQFPLDARKAWEAAIKAARIKRLTPHSCRHGFATGLLRRGVDVMTVAKLGGWKTASQVFKTYGHALDDRKLTDLLTQNEHSGASDQRKVLMRLVENE